VREGFGLHVDDFRYKREVEGTGGDEDTGDGDSTCLSSLMWVSEGNGMLI
jgi:hypothetical protein